MFDWTRICNLGIVIDGLLNEHQKKLVKQFVLEHEHVWLYVDSKYCPKTDYDVVEAWLYADEKYANAKLWHAEYEELIRSDSHTKLTKFDMEKVIPKTVTGYWYVCRKVKKLK